MGNVSPNPSARTSSVQTGSYAKPSINSIRHGRSFIIYGKIYFLLKNYN